MKYRYITARSKPEDSICNFRLISHRVIGLVAKEAGRTYYRVRIPDDLKLEKYSCDEYATTNDKRTLAELGCDLVMTRWDGSRKLVPEGVDVEALKKVEFQKWVRSLNSRPVGSVDELIANAEAQKKGSIRYGVVREDGER